jgi:Domain of unknown function (DUF4281)
MSPNTLFSLASSAAALAWLLLISGLLLQGWVSAPRTAQIAARVLLWTGGRLIPVLLCLGYAAAIARWWGTGPGGFSSLADVAALFTVPGMVLAGWVHYLAFDLWLGRWEIDALAAHTNAGWVVRLLVIPCLILTFLFGPIGLLLFLMLLRLNKLATPSRVNAE